MTSASPNYGAVGMLVIFTAFLLVMSVQLVRLQIYRHLQAAVGLGGNQHRPCQQADLRYRHGIARHLHVQRPHHNA
jgi:hypothetical protein